MIIQPSFARAALLKTEEDLIPRPPLHLGVQAVLQAIEGDFISIPQKNFLHSLSKVEVILEGHLKQDKTLLGIPVRLALISVSLPPRDKRV